MSTSAMDTVSSTSTYTTLLRSPQHSMSNHNHLISHLGNNPSASPLGHHMQHTNGSQTFESLLNDSETNGNGCTNTPLLQNALQNNAPNGLIDARHIKRENSVAAANPLLAGEYINITPSVYLGDTLIQIDYFGILCNTFIHAHSSSFLCRTFVSFQEMAPIPHWAFWEDFGTDKLLLFFIQ